MLRTLNYVLGRQRQLKSSKIKLRNWLAKHDQYDNVSYILKKETVL